MYVFVTKLGRRKKREQKRKILFHMLLMLPFSFSYPHLTFHIFIYIYNQNFKTNATFANSNDIGLMNNTFMRTKKKSSSLTITK